MLNGLLRGPNGSLRHRGEDSEKEKQKLLVDNLVSLSVQTMEKLITGKLHQLVARCNAFPVWDCLPTVSVWLTHALLSPACNSRTPMLKKVVSQLDVEEGELDCVLCAK